MIRIRIFFSTEKLETHKLAYKLEISTLRIFIMGLEHLTNHHFLEAKVKSISHVFRVFGKEKPALPEGQHTVNRSSSSGTIFLP